MRVEESGNAIVHEGQSSTIPRSGSTAPPPPRAALPTHGSVTTFFRAPDTFDALKTAIFPKLLEDRPRDAPIRVWVPGCATGEEVFSLALSLGAFLDEVDALEVPLKLFGTDINPVAVARARAATYPSSIEGLISGERLRRFFSKVDGYYVLQKEVRERCVFAEQDVMRDPPFARMDLVIGRNLMAHFGGRSREGLLRSFHYALKDSGVLVLGATDSLGSLPGFSQFDAQNGIYLRVPLAPARSEAACLSRAARRSGGRPSESQLQQEVVARLRARIEELEEDNVALREAVQESGSTSDDLRSTNDDLQAAKEELQAIGQELESVNQELRDRNAVSALLQEERVEQELERAEHGFREVLATAPEAILLADVAGRLTFANDNAQALFGYREDELVGLSIDDLSPEHLREGYARRRAAYLAHPSCYTVRRVGEMIGLRRDGTTFPLEFVVSSMARKNGPVLVVFVKEITQRRESEEKVRDYQERLQRMAFDTALAEVRERRRIAVEVHDHLGQALSLVQIKLSSLRASVATEVRVTFDDAIDLLARSIAQTRTLIFELSPPVLYDLGLKEALAWLVEEIGQRQGVVVDLVDDDAEKPLDEAVAALVFRSIRELLMNVFKHAKSRAAKVSLKRAGDHVDIDVEDSGIGFDAEAVDPTSLHRGFGLFSVREQMRQLGGTVEISSWPRQGTRVSMHVPIRGAGTHKAHALVESS